MKEHRYPLTQTEKLNFREGIPSWLRELGMTLSSRGFQVYLVGGAVRDLLWDRSPKDWDLATDALPDEVEDIFPHTIPTGKIYGTITVLSGKHQVEITTLREDSNYSDGRRPDEVRFSKDPVRDLSRRDFTINALAYDLARDELIDPFQGRKDLYRGVLRAVGDPKMRFREDGLRMFRFFRFMGTFGLKPDHSTQKAVNPDWARNVSMERIREELSKLLLGKWVRKGFTGMAESGLLGIFLPELDLIARNREERRLWEHILLTVETIQPELNLRLAALFHDIAKPATRIITETGVHFYGHDEQGARMTETTMERLRYPSRLTKEVSNLVRHHMFHFTPVSGDGAIRRFIARVGPEHVPDLLELRRADMVATGRIHHETWVYWQELNDRIRALLASATAYSPASLVVNGRDLMDHFGLTPGPFLGEVLQALRETVLDDPVMNEKEKLLRIAEEKFNLKTVR